jgi:gamma-glutamyltranspeptidase
MNRRALAAALAAIAAFAPSITPPAAATRNAQVTARRGMVASAHALASQSGLEMPGRGNAVDAAAAALGDGVVSDASESAARA